MNEQELKELSEKLREEGVEYYNLAKEYRRSSILKDKSENLLINRNWITKWKKYVDYQTIKESQQSYYSYSSYNRRVHKIDPEGDPGEIDNWFLLVPLNQYLNDGDPNNEENFVVRHDINTKTDLKIVNKKIWQFFYTRYGGGPQIEKPLIENDSSSYSSSKVVEVFLRRLQIITLTDRKNMTVDTLSQIKPEIIFISRTVYLESFKEKIIELKKLKNFYNKETSTQNIRLFKLQNISWEEAIQALTDNSEAIRNSQQLVKYDKLVYLEDIQNSKLDEVDLADTDICIVEYFEDESSKLFEVEKKIIKHGSCEYCNKQQYLRYPCVCKEVAYCTPRCMQMDKNYHRGRCRKNSEDDESSLTKTNSSRNGLVGLQNLGNTCFMNTSLQCLSNCYELTEYFLLDLFRKDINKDNPIGTGGDLASAYAVLLKNLWYGTSSVYSPWAFKRAISGFQSMFSGYMQHDTQEFLNFLLDGLHEDLNRVLKKPLVEKDDSKKDDDIKSVESWIGFLRRNQSLLVNLFYGQFKSTLYCPEEQCQNISTCFDPYLSISLPLVSRTEPYELTCFFIFFDCSIKPLQLDVQFSTETTVMALRNKVGKMLKIHPFSFLIVKLESLGVLECFLNSQNLLKPPYYSSTKKQQYFLFQIDPKVFYNPEWNRFALAEAQEKSASKNIARNNNNNTVDNIDTDKDRNSWETNRDRNFRNTKAEIEKDKSVLNELFDVYYEEDEHGGTQEEESYYSKKISRGLYKVNSDENYGFDEDWLRVVIYLQRYERDFSTGRRQPISYLRVIYLNKNWTLSFIHKYVFEYISHVIKLTNEGDKELSNTELFAKYYDKIIQNHSKNISLLDSSKKDSSEQKHLNNNNNDLQIKQNNLYEANEQSDFKPNLENIRRKILAQEIPDEVDTQKACGLPYRLRVSNAKSGSDYKPCYYCLSTQCQGCPVPYSDSITLKDYISEIPKSELGREIDNTYFYLHDRYKNFIGTGNRDFSLELSFLDDFIPAVKTLLEKEVIDFKVQHHERADGIEVIECFKNFIKLEKLEAKNEWFCPECKKHVKATKKMEIFNSPNILIIHLKRFKNNTKIDTLVKFPLEGLDVSEFVINKKNGEEKFVYDLFAVANHFGSMGFGHYTAYAKNYFNNKWYDFDDSHVSELHGKEIVTPSAYVLFYRKRNLRESIDLPALYNKQFVNFEALDLNGLDAEQLMNLVNGSGIKNGNGNNAMDKKEMDIDLDVSNGQSLNRDRNGMEIDGQMPHQSSANGGEKGFINLNNATRRF